jgi:hypothetical protein
MRERQRDLRAELRIRRRAQIENYIVREVI